MGTGVFGTLVGDDFGVVTAKFFPVGNFASVDFNEVVEGDARNWVVFVDKECKTFVDDFGNFEFDAGFGSEGEFFGAWFGNNDEVSFVVDEFNIAWMSVGVFDA